MKKGTRLLTIILLLSFFIVCKTPENQVREETIDKDVVYQSSPLNALMKGIFDGETTIQELKKHGDLGLGTFNALDGELIAIRGEFYQIDGEGKTRPALNTIKTPYAIMTFFEPDKTVKIDSPVDYGQFQDYLSGKFPTKNLFYAFKIEGTYTYMKVRSVPVQVKPYPDLPKVLETQPIFEFHDVQGALAGFWFPPYITEINNPGFHFHFITEDRTSGGHVLAFDMENATVEIDFTPHFFMALPQSEEFHKADFKKKEQD